MGTSSLCNTVRHGFLYRIGQVPNLNELINPALEMTLSQKSKWKWWRFCGWMAILPGLLGAEPRNLAWQTGRLRIDPQIQVDQPLRYPASEPQSTSRSPGPDFSGLPHSQEVFLRVHLTFRSAQGTYVVEQKVASSLPEAVLADPSAGDLSSYVGSPQQVLPWLANLPSPVSFAVQGKFLYYRDAQNKLHRARILHGQSKQ